MNVKFWIKCTFENCISHNKDKDKFTLQVNYVTPTVFTLFKDFDKYSDAIEN